MKQVTLTHKNCSLYLLREIQAWVW